MVRWLAMLLAFVSALNTAQAANEPASESLPETAALGGRWPTGGSEPPKLVGAALVAAPLVAATLRGADLRGADLRYAQLQGADLRNADLRGARLDGAFLQGARLRGAKLRGASLRGAKLARADLRRADLTLADLRGADFFIEPDWDALVQAVETRVPPRADQDRLVRSLDRVRARALSVSGATLDRTLLDRPVCVFPPVSALDVMHGYDTEKGKPVTATAEGLAPKAWIRERTALLGRLGCANRSGRVARAFAAGFAADRRASATETGVDANALIAALLKDDCAGGKALPVEVRNALMQKKGAAN